MKKYIHSAALVASFSFLFSCSKKEDQIAPSQNSSSSNTISHSELASKAKRLAEELQPIITKSGANAFTVQIGNETRIITTSKDVPFNTVSGESSFNSTSSSPGFNTSSPNGSPFGNGGGVLELTPGTMQIVAIEFNASNYKAFEEWADNPFESIFDEESFKGEGASAVFAPKLNIKKFPENVKLLTARPQLEVFGQVSGGGLPGLLGGSSEEGSFSSASLLKFKARSSDLELDLDSVIFAQSQGFGMLLSSFSKNDVMKIGGVEFKNPDVVGTGETPFALVMFGFGAGAGEIPPLSGVAIGWAVDTAAQKVYMIIGVFSQLKV